VRAGTVKERPSYGPGHQRASELIVPGPDRVLYQDPHYFYQVRAKKTQSGGRPPESWRRQWSGAVGPYFCPYSFLLWLSMANAATRDLTGPIHLSPFTIHHSPFTIHHSPFTRLHSPGSITCQRHSVLFASIYTDCKLTRVFQSTTTTTTTTTPTVTLLLRRIVASQSCTRVRSTVLYEGRAMRTCNCLACLVSSLMPQ